MTGQRLRLDCLGSGFAFSHGRYWSGFLLDGRILLDCPPQTLPHLFRLGVAAAEVELVLLSHAHSDHIGGVDLFLLEALQGSAARASAVRASPEAREQPLAIAGPPGIYARLREVVGSSQHLPERDDPRIEWFELGSAHPSERHPEGQGVERAGVRIEALAMDHSASLPALGFRVQHPLGVVAYSGDTAYGDGLLRLGEGADLLIVECGGDRTHGHMEWDDIRTLRGELRQATRILVTHYDPDAVPGWARNLEGVEPAEDFAVYEV